MLQRQNGGAKKAFALPKIHFVQSFVMNVGAGGSRASESQSRDSFIGRDRSRSRRAAPSANVIRIFFHSLSAMRLVGLGAPFTL